MELLVRAFARAVIRVPWLVIAIGFLITAVLGFYSSQQEQVTGNEGFAPDNAELTALERSGELFGGGQSVSQTIIDSDSNDVFTADAYAATQQVAAAIRDAVPAERLADEPDRPAILTYFAPLESAAQMQGIDPATLSDEQLKQLYQEAYAASPAELQGTLGALLPRGADAAEAAAASGLVLTFIDTSGLEGADGQAELMEIQQDLAAAVRGAELPPGITARPFAFELLFGDDSFLDEVARLFGLAALIILVVLTIVYFIRPRGRLGLAGALRRTAADVGVTLVGILFAITWMQGAGVLLGPDYAGVIGAFNPVTQIIPILLIGLGVDYAIHLTSRYREEIGQGLSVNDSTGRSINTVGVALTLATLTTVVGFLTNLTNPLPALRDFGILASVGMVAAFLILVTVIPAIRVLVDRRAERKQRVPREALASSQERALPETIGRTAILAERFPMPTLGVALVLGLLGAYGLTQLSTEFSFTDFVSDDDPNVVVYNRLQQEFGGGFGEQTDVVFDGDVATPEVHNAMAAAFENLSDVDDVRMVADQPAVSMPVTVLGQALAPVAGQEGAGGEEAPGAPDAGSENAAAVDPALMQAAVQAGLQPDLTVADDADVAALYEALLAGAPDLAGPVLTQLDDGTFAGRAVVQTTAGEDRAGTLAEQLETAFAPVEDAGVGVTPTSQTIISDVIVEAISEAQMQSLAITVAAAMILLVITFWIRLRRPLLGVITVVPVGLVLLWTFGLMAALGIPFSPVTATISALAIGIGVPFMIHVAIRFQEDRFRHGSTEAAIRSTARHTGGALAGSAFTTMAGFGVLIFSSLTPFRQLGTVVAIAIGCSLVASVLVLPSMLAMWDRWHRARGHVTAQPSTQAEVAVG